MHMYILCILLVQLLIPFLFASYSFSFLSLLFIDEQVMRKN